MIDVMIHANHVPWQRQYLPWFQSGFARHGFTHRHTTLDCAGPGSIHVIFANNSWKQTEATCRKEGWPLITVNRCFFGSRHDMVAIGWDGFNTAADFMPTGSYDRAAKHFLKFDLQPWKLSAKGYVLVCGDYGVKTRWLMDQVEQIPAYEKVVYRPHPADGQSSDWIKSTGWKIDNHGQDDIRLALEGAKACVTDTSIAGCESALAGVPTIAGRYSMARPVSFDSYQSFLESRTELPSRVEWLRDLADAQWDHKEIRTGEFWEHLKGGLQRRIDSQATA